MTPLSFNVDVYPISLSMLMYIQFSLHVDVYPISLSMLMYIQSLNVDVTLISLNVDV